MEDDVPIENRVINKSIESAQVKVEAHHFDMRKHLVDYDDVVNNHRDVIYKKRDNLLPKESTLKSVVLPIIKKQIQEILDSYLRERTHDDWDVEGLLAELKELFTTLPPELSDPDDVFEMPSDAIEKRVHEWAVELYHTQEEEIGSDKLRAWILIVRDSFWEEHLTKMGNLREGIGLEAYGQRNPLVMYQMRARGELKGLTSSIDIAITLAVFWARAVLQAGGTNGRQRPGPALGRAAPNAGGGQAASRPSASRKVGRNAPCPCGSGKKYKRCHGA